MKVWQIEHSSALVEVISCIHKLCGLPSTPAKAKKMGFFRAAQDMDNQPSSSCCLSMDDASSDILAYLHCLLGKKRKFRSCFLILGPGVGDTITLNEKRLTGIGLFPWPSQSSLE